MASKLPPITEEIASLVTEGDLGDAAPELTQLVTRALVDTVGVAVAARSEKGVIALQRAIRGEMCSGSSTVFPTGRRISEAQAALINGMASHALDYDDVGDAIYGHPSAALFPSLLAVAESEGASGRALIEAYVIGFQVMCAIAAGLPIRQHYSKGWHSTATVGVIGATAGVCRLLGLPAASVRYALGIAASMASGSRQNFGTMTKPLHPGLVGRNAIIAARLAQNGFTADASQLEAKLGYFALFGVDSDLSIVEVALAKHWALLSEGINVKKYPCCYNTHRTADATLSLSRKVDLSHGVDRITLTMEPGGLDPLIHHRPVTGLEAKFSGEYVVAAGLVDGLIGLDSFTDASVQRPAVQELLCRVEVVESAKPPFGGEQFEFAYAAVEVESGGHVLRERVDIPKGDARSPLNDAEIDAKFRDCLAFSKVGWDAGALLTKLRELHNSHRLGGFEHMVERELVPHVQEVDVSVE